MKAKKLWAYDLAQNFELRNDLIDNYKIKGRIYEDINAYYDIMGMMCHPGLKQQKEHTEPVMFSFQNTLVDINTLKILFQVLSTSKIVTLRFSSNNFIYNNLEYLIENIINKQNNIVNFIFEWNSKIKIDSYNIDLMDTDVRVDMNESELIGMNKVKGLICKLVTSSRIEALCLRGNVIGDDGAAALFENLKHNNILRILNLYRNNICSKAFAVFLELIENNRILEDINLGGNSLTDQDLDKLKDYIGKFELSHEDVEDYNKKLKERDVIIEKNKKLKTQKKPEESIPHIPDVQQVDGVYYSFKNTKIKFLNLFQNSFTSECLPSLIKMIESHSELTILIDEKIFSKEDIDMIRIKYNNRIYFSKN